MRYRYAPLRWIPVLLLMVAAMVVTAAEEPDVELPADVDVRFLVDVSGSMKRTDPNNLRRSAVAMVAELMPAGSRGGLWSFARYVNMLAPLGEVDDQWRREVRDAVSRIDSPGQYTNIGVALDTVTNDFWPGGGYENTHVVLLTDGMVDVPDGEEASRAERERILDEVVGHFNKHGASLHTMALSEEADHALLEQLAVETGGQYTVAKSDSDLTRAFLSAFGAASPTEEVPLTDNGFDIDETVEEFTALIFREEGAGAAELVSPGGRRYTRDDLPGDARWHATDDYDLVTIPEPETGRWEVDAIVGPDSRIKVVSQLRMSVSDLPAHFYASDSVPVSVAFFEEGERLTDQDFLKLLDLRVEIHDEEGGRRGTRRLSSDELPENGIFRDSISTLGEPGRYEVRIIADGETFQRSERQTIQLRPPFDTEVQARGSGDQSRYRFRVMARDPGIDRETVSVNARVKGPDGETRAQELAPADSGVAWEWVLTGERGEGSYEVSLDVQGETQNGRPVELSVAPFEATFPRESEQSDYLALRPREPKPELAPVVEPDPEPETSPESDEPAAPKFDPEPVTPPEPEPEMNDSGDGISWWIWGSGIAALMLALGGGAGVWLWRRRGARNAPEEEQEAEQTVEPEPAKSPEPEPTPEAEEASEPPNDGDSLAKAAAAYQAQQTDEGEEEPEEPELEADLDSGAENVVEPEEESGGDDQADSEGESEQEDDAGEEAGEAEEEAIPTLDTDQPSDEDSEPAESEPEAETEPAPEPEEPAPEPEAESEEEPEPEAEALADQILDENQSEENEDDDEFSLEDFDISEFDDLPEQEAQQDDADEPKKDENGEDDEDNSR